jgi:hypothetical protein
MKSIDLIKKKSIGLDIINKNEMDLCADIRTKIINYFLKISRSHIMYQTEDRICWVEKKHVILLNNFRLSLCCGTYYEKTKNFKKRKVISHDYYISIASEYDSFCKIIDDIDNEIKNAYNSLNKEITRFIKEKKIRPPTNPDDVMKRLNALLDHLK